MRILTITSGFPSEQRPYHGIFVWRQMQALIERGHTFHVLKIVSHTGRFYPHPARRYAASKGYTYEGQAVDIAGAFFPPRLFALPLVRLQLGRVIGRAISAFSPDVIHAHGVIPGGYLAMGHDVPMVLTAHGADAYDAPYRRPDLLRASRRAIHAAQVAVGVSRFVESHIRALGGKRTSVIYNGADEAVFFPRARGAARLRLGIPETAFVVAFVGNVVKPKGIDELGSALIAIRDLAPTLLVAGDGSQRANLSERLESAGLKSFFLGPVAHEQLVQVYAAADVVTLPTYAEGMPVVLAEAMLSGRAMVATPVGGIPEMLEDGVNGLLVPVRDAPALAAALRRLHDDAVLRAAIELAARRTACEHLTWQKNAAAYESVYGRALSSPGPA